jgi:hypothetical protein
MARTAITLRKLVPNSSLAAPTADTVDQANGMTLAIPTSGIPVSPDADHLILVVNNSAGSTKTCTIKAGANPPAFRAGLGDLVVSLTTTQTAYIGPLETARFKQADSSLSVDFAAGFTGSITALIMPTRW